MCCTGLEGKESEIVHPRASDDKVLSVARGVSMAYQMTILPVRRVGNVHLYYKQAAENDS